MAEYISNPSFEDGGAEPGTALNWTYTTSYSFFRFATFNRSTPSGFSGPTIVVNQIPNIPTPVGVAITPNPDGSIFITVSEGILDAFEGFENAWASNELFLFAFGTLFLDKMAIQGKHVEDFGAGWGEDDYLKTKAPSSTASVTFFPTVVSGSLAGRPIDALGARRIVATNTASILTIEANTHFYKNILTVKRAAAGSTLIQIKVELDVFSSNFVELANLVQIQVRNPLQPLAHLNQYLRVGSEEKLIIGQTANLITLASPLSAIPVVGKKIYFVGMPLNKYAGGQLRHAGAEILVNTNNADTFFLDANLPNIPAIGDYIDVVDVVAPPANTLIRVLGGPNNDVGLLDEVDDINTELFTERFAGGWKANTDVTGPLPNTLDKSFNSFKLGKWVSLPTPAFTDGFSLSAPGTYADSFFLKVFRAPPDEGGRVGSVEITATPDTGPPNKVIRITYVVPWDVEVDPINGTIIYPTVVFTTFPAIPCRVRDLLNPASILFDAGDFEIYGSPGNDLRRPLINVV